MNIKNVSRETTRHGRIVYYFKAGGRRIRLPDDYGSEGFLAAVSIARATSLARAQGEREPGLMTERQRVRYVHKRNIEATLKRAVKSSKARAKLSGVANDLDLDWALRQAEDQQFKCALTNIPFYMESDATSRRHPFLPSIDRIKAGGDYTKDNVRIVVYAVNVMLMDWGAETFEIVADGYRRTQKPNKPAEGSHLSLSQRGIE
jgi:hypothetical protein